MDHVDIPTKRGKIERIAFRTGRGLGDAVLCEPLIRATAATYPAASLTVILAKYCRGMSDLGYGRDLFEDWMDRDEFASFVADFDLVIDADPVEYVKPFWSAMDAGGDLVHLFGHYDPSLERTTAFDRMADGLARIGIDATMLSPKLTVSNSVQRATADTILELGLRTDVPTISIHPGSNAVYAFKRWPSQGFAFVADEFSVRYGANIIFMGSGEERALVDTIKTSMKYGDSAKYFGDRPICEVAALLAKSDLVIGNDSGIGHLAAALGRPVVTIAGPTSARFWAPLTEHALVLDAGGCCFNPASCGVACLTSIRGCDVVGAAEALLTATTNRELYPCLDPIRVASDLNISDAGDAGMVFCSRSWDTPLAVPRGGAVVVQFLDSVEATGSSRQARLFQPDGEILLEQCLRHGIVLPGFDTNPHQQSSNERT